MRYVKIGFAIFISVVTVAAMAVFFLTRPGNLDSYSHIRFPPADQKSGPLSAQFLGVSTIYITDGQSHIMTDGFFSRPSLGRVLFLDLEPDQETIKRSLNRAGITRLDVIVPLHSHYDHAMDSADVAKITNATLVGSPSSANIAIGHGLEEDRIQLVEMGRPMQIGQFRLTVIQSRHSPNPVAPTEVSEPLFPPAGYKEYAMGQCYSVLIEHPEGSALIQGSAGFEPGALDGLDVDVVFLGVGALGKQSADYRDRYWKEVVQAVNPERIILIHWDDFWIPLDEPLKPLPSAMDDFDSTMDWLKQKAHQESIDLVIPYEFQTMDPYAGLSNKNH
ncbi:MAG: MBL fold metallo-hydrolase [Leptospiraceae bacterium]